MRKTILALVLALLLGVMPAWAVSEADDYDFTVTLYDPDGNTVIDTLYAQSGDPVPLPTPEKAAQVCLQYTFTCWEDEEGTEVPSPLYVDRDTKLYAVYEEKVVHTIPEEWTVVKEPSCTESGVEERRCGVCLGEVETRFIKPLNHTPASPPWKIGVLPGQGFSGYRYAGCAWCGTIMKQPLPPLSFFNQFNDVHKGTWYYDAVGYVSSNGLFNGLSRNQFAPDMAMNRGMLVTVLYRMSGSPETEALGTPFTDVEPGRYYYEAVRWAASHGIVEGVTDTQFAPEKNVTREQIATVLYRYEQFLGYDVAENGDISAFPDALEVSDFARSAMAWAYECKLINGTKVAHLALLDPKSEATRAQVAMIFMRNKIRLQ